VKINLLYFFVMLALLAGLTRTARAVVTPDTNVVYSFPLGFAQGLCNDGTNTYIELTGQIIRRDQFYKNGTNYIYNQFGTNYINNSSPASGLTGFSKVHLGDPDYYQGCIYSPMEAGVGAPQGSVNIDIAIFLAPDLTRSAAISISNYQSEVSAVCIDPVLSNSVALFATSYVSVSTNDGIYEYSVNDLTNLAFVEALPLTQNIPYLQGIICVGGMLYAMSDNGAAGEVYQINPTNGVVVDLAQVNIAGEKEWEGLDYFHGYLVANEGATGTINWFNFFGLPPVGANQNITGSVNDSNDNPIAGVGVSAMATINGTNYQTATVDTDSNGNYSLNIPDGNWSVAVNCSGGNDSLGNLGNYDCPDNQNASIAGNNATNNFIVQITGASNMVQIATTSLPDGTNGSFYSATLSAGGGQPPYTWSLSPDSADLPLNLSLTADGVLSGTAATNGAFNFSVRVTDSLTGIADQTLSLNLITTNLPPPYTIYNKINDLIAGLSAGGPPDTNSLMLTVGCVGGNLALVYPGWASNYVVETSANSNPGLWTTLGCAPTNINDCNAVVVPLTNLSAFFRLRY
jgi:hypothetical protein